MTPEMIHAFQRDRKLVLTEKGITYRTVRRLSLEASPHTIDCQERAMEFLSDLFDYRPTEALYAIALNSCNDLLGMILLSNGTVDRATVYPLHNPVQTFQRFRSKFTTDSGSNLPVIPGQTFHSRFFSWAPSP